MYSYYMQLKDNIIIPFHSTFCCAQLSRAQHVARISLAVFEMLYASRLDPSGRCIIFADTTHETRTLLSHPALGHRAQAVNSESSIQERDRILTAFANLEPLRPDFIQFFQREHFDFFRLAQTYLLKSEKVGFSQVGLA